MFLITGVLSRPRSMVLLGTSTFVLQESSSIWREPQVLGIIPNIQTYPYLNLQSYQGRKYYLNLQFCFCQGSPVVFLRNHIKSPLYSKTNAKVSDVTKILEGYVRVVSWFSVLFCTRFSLQLHLVSNFGGLLFGT